MNRKWFPRAAGAVTLAVLAACGGDNDSPAPSTPTSSVTVVSSSPQYVSGGDARIRINAAASAHAGLQLWLNGARITPTLVASGDTLEGVIDGLVDGANTLEVRYDGRVSSTLAMTNYPITGPMLSGPHQTPFVCTTAQLGKQPLVDSAASPGYPVTDAGNNTIGYSRDCSLDTYVTYRYRTTGNAWADMPADGSRPADMKTITLEGGRTVDFVVRQERGTINRFIYSFAMLAPANEDRAKPDLSLWNKRLQYYFQGGVAIGHSQGTLHSRSMEADVLAQGYAIVHSSGNNTGTHYNLQVAGETAMMTKERFVERYGAPLYTFGLGGSGGAIQQYILAQNNAGVLDAALPVQSYPDMVTQTIHVGDCELLEHYMDVTDKANAKWRTTKNRTWLVGMNAEETPAGQTDVAKVNDPFADAKTMLGLSTARGSTECRKAWLGLAALTMNPHYGQADNQAKYVPQSDIAAIQWTHYDDLRNIYGVDGEGNPRTTWDNVGVQYALQTMKEGKVTPEEFLDVNFKIGGWKKTKEMVQEGFPFLGTLAEVMADTSKFDLWSKRNMNLQPAAGQPAPRTEGDMIAMRAAYTSGMVFGGNIPLPTIDHRQYMERELDMHNTHQSFAVRKRIQQKMGNSDHQVIWFTDTQPGVTKASQSMDAMRVMDEWMANIRANPTKTIAQNRPLRAVDSCFDVTGKLIYGGNDAWDGVLDNKPKGPCTLAFPMYSTSRIVAGAPLEGGIYKCALKSVDAAVADGTYAPWVPDAGQIATLKQIFPTGVCDYSKPDTAKPT